MRRVMYLAGLPVGLVAADDLAPAVELLFGGCAPSDEAPVVEIEVCEQWPERPSRPPDVADADHVDLWFEPDGLVVFERLGLGAAVFRDRVVAGGRGGDDRSWRLVVQYALVDALARQGRHAVHAAAIARSGRVLLAFGEGGAGKSTLAYAAWRRGWQVLGDDLAWLQRGGPDAPLFATGFPKPLVVPAELLAGVPPAGAVAITGDDRDRWVLPYDAITTGPSLPVVGVVQLAHSDRDARLEDGASGPDLLATVLRAHPLVESGRMAKEFFPLAAAASRLPAMTLRHDADPLERVERAGDLLDDVFERCVRQ